MQLSRREKISDRVLANRCHLGNRSERASFLVPTVSVDAIVQQLGTYTDVIKVDVDYAELSDLKGAQVTLQDAELRVLLSTKSAVLRSNSLTYPIELGNKFKINKSGQ